MTCSGGAVKAVRFVFLLGLAGLTAACSAIQPKVAAPPRPSASSTLLALPEASLDSGRYDDALRQYQAILASDPDNRQAKLGIAEVQLATNNNRTAADLFTELAQDPDLKARALQGKGLALMKLGQREAAQKALADAVAADKTLWRAWSALGALYDGVQAWDKADAAYHEALGIVPDSAVVENNYGFSLMLRKDFPAAVAAFQKALKANPMLDAAKMNLRLALAMQGHYEEAASGVQGKDAPAALNNVGFAAMLRGDYKQAEMYLVQALDASPSEYAAASKNLQHLKALEGQPETAGAKP